MKFMLTKDIVVETVADELEPQDVIASKVNSIGREVKILLQFTFHLPVCLYHTVQNPININRQDLP